MFNKNEKEIAENWTKGDFDNPVVAIICSVYNHEKYISRCIDGFLMQETNFAFLIIIHDDASTDGTQAILQEYERKYPNIIKVIYEQENQHSKGKKYKNKLFPNLKCEYIATCEGDDYWCYEKKLQLQYEFLENNKEYVAVGHLTNTIDKKGRQRASFIDSKPGDYTIDDLNRWQLFSHFSSHFYRNIYKNMSLEEIVEHSKLKAPGDRTLPILFMRFGKLYVIHEVWSTYTYMSNPTSFMSVKSNSTIYTYYRERYAARYYAKKYGIIIDYKKIEKEYLTEAFLAFLGGTDDGLFLKTLKTCFEIKYKKIRS